MIFEQSVPRSYPRNSSDDVGKIQVRVLLVGPRGSGRGSMKGNITRSFIVKDSKVSIVDAALKKCLFGGER